MRKDSGSASISRSSSSAGTVAQPSSRTASVDAAQDLSFAEADPAQLAAIEDEPERPRAERDRELRRRVDVSGPGRGFRSFGRHRRSPGPSRFSARAAGVEPRVPAAGMRAATRRDSPVWDGTCLASRMTREERIRSAGRLSMEQCPVRGPARHDGRTDPACPRNPAPAAFVWRLGVIQPINGAAHRRAARGRPGASHRAALLAYRS